MFFLFNDTATTEIYTYGHTLSLHDALPISARRAPCKRVRRRHQEKDRPGADRAYLVRPHLDPRLRTGGRKSKIAGRGENGPGAGRACRSEEHTSELQSLMRISYAVFCLKKQKRPQNIHLIKTPTNIT